MSQRTLQLAVLLVLGVGGCSDSPLASGPDTAPEEGRGSGRPAASVTVSPESLGIEVGSTGTLIAEVRDADGNVLEDRTIAWSSSDGSLATVSDSGVVTGEAEGEATITATSGDASGSAGVTVASVPAATEVTCGQVITESITLAGDVGPCPVHGLIVGADDIVIDGADIPSRARASLISGGPASASRSIPVSP